MHCIRFILLLLLLVLACDVREKPGIDPAELFERGVSLFNEQSYPQAEELFRRALEQFDKLNNRSDAARALGYLGQIKLAQGQYRAAVERWQTALEASRAANDYRAESQLHIFFGDLFVEMGEYTTALQHYQGALSYYSAFGDRNASAGVELKMARAYRWAGELELALQFFERAYSYYNTTGDGNAKAEALDGVGEVYALQGRDAEALNSYSQGLTAVSSSSDPVLAARLKLHAGLSHRTLGNPNAALEQMRDAVNSLRSKQVAPALQSLILFSIGNVYFHNGRLSDAKGYYAQASSAAQRAGDNIAQQYNAILMLRCDELQMKPADVPRETDRLIQAYRALAEAMRNCGHRTGEAYALAQVGRLYATQGDVQRSEEAYAKAVQITETIVGEYVHPEIHRPYLVELSLETEREEWYRALAELLLVAKRPQESFSVLEKRSSHRLYERLFQVDVSIRHLQLQHDVLKTRETLRQLKRLEVEWSRLLAATPRTVTDDQYQALQREIGKLKEEVAQAADRIVHTYPNYELLVRPSDRKVSELQSLIPRGTLVVRFLPATERLYMYVLSRTRFEVRSSPISQRALLNQVHEYLRLMNDPAVYAAAAGAASLPAMTRFGFLSSQLYEHFLRPIDGLYERNLLIIPGNEFEGVPFHALERQDRRGNVQYVVEFMSVDYLPSLTTLVYRTAMSVRTREVVAFGNPTGKSWSVDYELRDIRSFYKGATIFIGPEASWQNLMNARGDVLQISSEYGRVRETQPLGMFILAAGAAQGGVMEVPFEKLSEAPVFPVVYLSNQLGEGSKLSAVHALVLRIAGTGDVFLNAWYADRKAAKFFSEYFYAHLANGLAPGDAYRQALLNMIRTKDISHPRAWGQFFHYGTG